MERQPLEIQNLYAELLEQLITLEAQRSIGSVPGCFVSKEVKGTRYCYFQYSSPGGAFKQVYIGRETAELNTFIEKYQRERELFKTDAVNTERLCTLLKAGGAITLDSASGRILTSLADAGFFKLQGVLVGTYAFSVLGNTLGVNWDHAAVRTLDIDIAGTRKIDIVVPELSIDLPETIQSLEMGFLPVPSLSRAAPSTSFKIRGKSLRVDLLTPDSGVDREPVYIPRFHASAQPVPYLDYLIDASIPAAAITGAGVLINVPSPARFAIHKLIISAERPATWQGKAGKDLMQASQLLEYLFKERPDDVKLALEEICRRGSHWVNAVHKGSSRIEKLNPSLFSWISGMLHGTE